jgi:hypothetical protein
LSDSEFRTLVATPLQKQREAEGQFKIAYARLCFTRQGKFLLGVPTMVRGKVELVLNVLSKMPKFKREPFQ